MTVQPAPQANRWGGTKQPVVQLQAGARCRTCYQVCFKVLSKERPTSGSPRLRTSSGSSTLCFSVDSWR